MDHCRYCRKEVSLSAGTCDDCADYETAVRVASGILQDSDVECSTLAASLGAEIVREFLGRSMGGARARQSGPPLGALQMRRGRPLL